MTTASDYRGVEEFLTKEEEDHVEAYATGKITAKECRREVFEKLARIGIHGTPI
tara:strand:+ start:479 stop:640 length:162 start_codon:yes stop_codon:yes gene_type:complete